MLLMKVQFIDTSILLRVLCTACVERDACDLLSREMFSKISAGESWTVRGRAIMPLSWPTARLALEKAIP